MLELLAENRCFGGKQQLYLHQSREIGLPMKFTVYRPPAAELGPVPALFFLAGLTCTEETFAIKAGAQQFAAEHGLMLILPDTSPRGAEIDGETNDWDFGLGAGFYVDATQEPWRRHYRMESYIVDELYELALDRLGAATGRVGISGHSMGGHGALVLALRHPGRFASVSAFAPISAPMQCPWGQKAFSRYLGIDVHAWRDYDASELMSVCETPYPAGILVDQGLDDKFLEDQLHPHLLELACQRADQPLTLRRHAGYDHGYYFISTFMRDHIAHHAAQLGAIGRPASRGP
jgi:S-formylglutathione hydrolase